jgi:uncharacterized protein
MQFEWDEEKRRYNIEKHGLDFQDAMMIWRKPVLDPVAVRIVGLENRAAALGIVGDDEIIVVVIYTMRDSVRRIISARRARRNERKDYKDCFGLGR